LSVALTPGTDFKALSRDRFGRFASRYVQSMAHARGAELRQLVAMAEPQASWTVLDIATGGGHTALAFAPHVAHVVATDLAPQMLDEAQRFLKEQTLARLSFGVADAEDLPFANGTFDLVTCRIAPHHFHDAARFVSEAVRVLRPVGVLLVQDHRLPHDDGAARYIDAWERLRDPSHNRAFSREEWKRMFDRAGLQVYALEEINKQHSFIEWTQRQGCTRAIVGQLVADLRAAPAAVLAWMEPHSLDRPEASFVNRHILIAGWKR
jgi:ubiquinone/menaquinone biosynthesis C-methylase UbiE